MTTSSAGAYLYFAYGSNLNREDLAAFARRRGLSYPLSQPLEPAWLPDAELAFSHRSESRGGGVLDVRPRRGQLVPGMLFEVDDAGLAVLDAKEGPYYERVVVHVLTADDQVQRALTYRIRPDCRRPHVPPSRAYVDVVTRGMRTLRVAALAQLDAAAADRDPSFEVDAVFVYGTLLQGQPRYRLLDRQAELRDSVAARVRGRLVDLGAYPGLIAGTSEVHGETHRIANLSHSLAVLDDVEGFRGYGLDSLYCRVLATTISGDGVSTRAWTYRYNQPTHGVPTIPSGSWRVHVRRTDHG